MRNKLLLVVVLFFAVGAVASTMTVYQDYGAWLNATSPANFAPPLPQGCNGQWWCHYQFQPVPVNESQNPYSAVLSSDGSFGPPRGVFMGVYDQVWTDLVTVPGNEFTTWSVPGVPLYAFGAYWDFSPAGYGNGLTLTISGSFGSLHVADICNPANCVLDVGTWAVPDGTWFGVVTNFPFDSFTISADHQPGNSETFDVAGLDMATVPEPGSLILLGSGILGIAGTLRRKLF